VALDDGGLSPYVHRQSDHIGMSYWFREGRFLRLLLTLLALISGWSVSDRAVAAPALPAAMGAMVLLADTNGQVEKQEHRRRAPEAQKDRRKSSGGMRNARTSAPPHLPGFLPGVDRAIE
jgi:hypothetical protein